MNTSIKVRPIQKEEIYKLKFPHTEVLADEIDRLERRRKLEEGQRLGNLEKVKLQITFWDDTAIRQVYTTIWAVGEEFIQLKKGVHIPIHRILQIERP